MKTKTRKQKPKSGKVLRISDYAWSFVKSRSDEYDTSREAVDGLVNELIDLTVRLEQIMKAPTYYVLPESLLQSEPEARGEAILRAVKKGKRQTEAEPVAVKVI